MSKTTRQTTFTGKLFDVVMMKQLSNGSYFGAMMKNTLFLFMITLMLY